MSMYRLTWWLKSFSKEDLQIGVLALIAGFYLTFFLAFLVHTITESGNSPRGYHNVYESPGRVITAPVVLTAPITPDGGYIFYPPVSTPTQ